MMRRMKKLQNTQGAAMIAVLCIMAVFMALSFSILLAASLAMTSSQKTLGLQKCKVLATSYAEVLKKDLTNTDEAYTGEDKLQGYLRREMANGFWYYYAEGETFHSDKAAVTKTFAAKDAPKNYELEVAMYWEPPESKMIDFEDQNTFKNSVLHMAIECRAGGQKFKLSKSYILNIPSGGDEKEVVWIWNESEKEDGKEDGKDSSEANS